MILEAYDRTFPLSLSQQNIWNLERTVPGTSINNICTTIRIQGRLDFLLLQKSLNLLLQADRSLRAQLTREGIPFDEAWRQTACRAEGFFEKDRELLLRFGEGFGASDAEGQISHCRLTMELLRRRLEEAGEEKKQKGRLYRMLGVLGSLGAALLLC